MSLEILYPINTQLPSPRANSIQVVNTCHALCRSGITVHLLARREGSLDQAAVLDYYGLPPDDRLHLHFLPTALPGNPRVFNLTYQVSMLRRLVALRRPGVRQCLFTRDLLCASTALRLRRVLKLPVAFEVHALNHWTNPLFTNTKGSAIRLARLKGRERYVYGRASALVAISEGCRAALEETFDVTTPVDVIHDGTSLFIDPRSKTDSGDPRLLYVGQFYPWKGVETAVRAMGNLPGLSLDLYGGDYFTAAADIARLKGCAAEVGASESVVFRGYVPPGRIRDIMAQQYIGILPAADNVMGRHFISPLKLFEYMGCSIAVVASDLPPIREIITHGRNGLLFAPGDPADLARQIRRLVDDPTLTRSLVLTAYQDAKGYSYDRRAERLRATLERVVPR